MERKTVSGMMLAFLFISKLTLAFDVQPAEAYPATITVPDDYPTIQEALNHANTGDTVYVRAGRYYENVVVNKSVFLIGENKINTVIDGIGKGTVLQVITNNAQVEQFTIQNGSCGIDLEGCGNMIRSNVVMNNSAYGILTKASRSSLVGNTVLNNGQFGLTISDSSENLLRNNNLTMNLYNFAVESGTLQLAYYVHDIDTSNTVDGNPIWYLTNQQNRQVPSNAGFVAVINSSRITVQDLRLTKNGYGVLLAYSANCSVVENTFSGNFIGVYLLYSDGNIIERNALMSNSYCGINNWIGSGNNSLAGNVIADNEGYGILFHGPGDDRNKVTENVITGNGDGIHFGGDSFQNIVSGNIIANNDLGFSIDYSTSNVVTENNVTNNRAVLWLWATRSNRLFHNNFINNQGLGTIMDSSDFWDDNYPSGGNYWSDDTGIDMKSGLNQDLPGSDGISDTPYIIDAYNRDHYPLMKPYTTPFGIHDIAVLNVTLWVREAYPGQTVYISTTVRNNGDFPDNRTITAYYDSHLIGSQTVTLAPSQNITLAFTWNTQSVMPGNYTIKAVANVALGEANTTDNTLIDGTVRIKILGDVNGDNKVDVKDIALAALAFGSCKGNARWKPDGDMDADGKVDIRDIALIAKNFGKIWPP